MNLLFFITVIALLPIIGTQHLLFPRRLQEDVLRGLPGIRARLPFIRRYIASGQYLLQIRLFGLICYLIAVLLTCGLLDHGRLPVTW